MKILHVEDEKWFHQLVKNALSTDEVTWATSTRDALALLEQDSFDLILLDRSLGDEDSFEALPRLLEQSPESTLLVLSSDAHGDAIARALELGAHDYLIKTPAIGEDLPLRIQVAAKARRSAHLIKRNLQQDSSRIIGLSAHTAALRERIQKLSPMNINILITGESGTGKEVLASELHRSRGESLRPFVTINCGAIPENVFESELFGHVKGAFTGASSHREGLLMAANGGDLFLDEVGDLPLSQQVKLLRFIQEGTFTPVGSTQERRSNVRIIAATNKQLEEEVRLGRFREDLFYRLDVYRLHTKPLRERVEDIAPLADHFVTRFSGESRKITREAKKLLERQPWRGNVRELSAVIQRALVEAGEDDIRAAHIQVQNIGGRSGPGLILPRTRAAVSAQSFDTFVNAAVRSYLETALELHEGNTLSLARALQISRATVYNKMNRLNVRPRRHGN